MTNEETVNDSHGETSVQPPGYCFLTNEQLREFQINEANLHQLAVDYGKCWEFYPPSDQTDLPASTMFPLNIKLADSSADEYTDLEWSNEQKSTFIELVGRWTATALPEIADHINKPLFECQAYLNMLKGHPRCIDTAEIPAAEEMPSEKIEFDIETEVDTENAVSSKKQQLMANKTHHEVSKIFNRIQLESRLGRHFQPADLVLWEEVLAKKLREWITEFMKQYLAVGGICKDQTKYLDKIFENDRRIRSLIDQASRSQTGLDVDSYSVAPLPPAESKGATSSEESVEQKTPNLEEFESGFNSTNGDENTRDETSDNELISNNESTTTEPIETNELEAHLVHYFSPEFPARPHARPSKRRKLGCFRFSDADDEQTTEVSLNALSDSEDPTEDLIDQETEWLEQLDQFNSMHSLLARGLPASSISPPPPRTAELEKFMGQN